MKRIYSFLTLLLIAAAPVALTGCDDDEPGYWYEDWLDDNGYDDSTPMDMAMAQTLNGTWTGTLTNEYTDDSGQRVQTQCYVDFSFVQYTARASYGKGYETDYVPMQDADGKIMYDDNGNPMYDQQTLEFNWSIDSRTFNIYLDYTQSGMRYVLDSRSNSATSGFSLGWDKRKRTDVFNGVMEGVNNDEYVFFDCERVTANASAAKSVVANAPSFGKAVGVKRTKTDVPFALHAR